MKLLFLYIHDYRTHQKLGLNFDANYWFEYDDGVLRFKRRDVLPPRFYAIKNSKRVTVENVSAIIGPNGSGKTSIVSFMDEVFSGGISRENLQFLYVIRQSERNAGISNVICRHNLTESLVDDEARKAFNGRWTVTMVPAGTAIAPLPASLIYYSPFFTTQKVLGEETRFVDISTAGYMRSCSNLKEYQQNERDRILSLIRKIGRKRNAFAKGMPFPAPCYINLRISDNPIRENPRFEERRREFVALANARDPILRLVCKYVQRIPESNPAYVSFLIDQLVKASNSIDKDTQLSGFELDPEKPFSRWKSLKKRNQESVKKQLIKALSSYEVDLVEDPWRVGYFETHAAMLSLLSDLNDLCAVTDSCNMFEIRAKIRSPKQQELLYKILGAIDTLETGYWADFLQDLVSVEVGQMSTGEMAYLTLMARLNDSIPNVAAKDVLLFLDEAETTLHPGWQRQLVHNIVWYFENFNPHLQVHVIFASHSPMLLSDMPLENVTILGAKGECALGLRTFGANVFDLYRASFGLDSGVFGAIARKKLDDLLDKIDKHESFDEDDIRVAKLFGNRVIADYLNSVIGQVVN